MPGYPAGASRLGAGNVGPGGVRVPGGPPGLQNRWTARCVAGGFDSRPPPREPSPGNGRRRRRRVATVDSRRHVPRTDVVLADPRLVAARERLGGALVKAAVARAQDLARSGAISPASVTDAAAASLPPTAATLTPVINATGVLVHTNLGRAPLSAAAQVAVQAAAGY